LPTGHIVLAFSVYERFESEAVAKSGIVPTPASSEKQLGGHAVLAVG
jgi:co-chaperonin GroES (HSP10)